jgi:ABC-type multidrug transport system ATPase subunit
MAASLCLAGFRLAGGKRPLDLDVRPGQLLAVAGTPEHCGAFLSAARGEARLAEGRADSQGLWLAPKDLPGRRPTLASLGGRKAPSDAQERLAQAITDLGLWEHRSTSIAELPPTAQRLSRLVPVFAEADGILALDQEFDSLDPWAAERLQTALQRFRSRGGIVVHASARADFLERADVLVVLKEQEIVFGGPLEDLWRKVGAQTLEVATKNAPAVRALVEPFRVQVTETDEGLRLEAAEGQALAARLLRDGYGDVRYVVVRRPALLDAIRAVARS